MTRQRWPSTDPASPDALGPSHVARRVTFDAQARWRLVTAGRAPTLWYDNGWPQAAAPGPIQRRYIELGPRAGRCPR